MRSTKSSSRGLEAGRDRERLTNMRETMRKGSILAVRLLAATSAVSAQSSHVIVEDWSKTPIGQKGVPNGWKTQSWGSPKYEFEVVSESPTRVLPLVSNGDSSTINKDIKIDCKDYPVLQWRWKAVELPKGGDARKKATDDQALQIYITFPRFPSAVRSRVIGYIWDTTAPAGTIVKSQKTGTVTYVIVSPGDAE